MQTTYKYLIQSAADVKGFTQSEKAANELSKVHDRLGLKLKKGTQAQKVLGTTMVSTKAKVDGTRQAVKRMTTTWRDQNGQLHKTEFLLKKNAGKWALHRDQVKHTTGEIKKSSDAHGLLGSSLGKLAGRALLTIPIWMVLRGIYQTVFSVIKQSVTAYSELAVEMSRVSTVTRGNESDINKLREATLDYGRDSSRSFKESASALYALGSAGLTVSQQLAGLKSVMDLSIGTGGNVESTSKLAAGAFNVFGSGLEGTFTDTAKFKKISDTLAYTYSTQQVEMSEIATAMSYVASVGGLLNVKFEDLVGTIGFLNTGMLKGSKSGTALMNAFIQLAAQSDKLSKIGIEIDPNKALDMVDVMNQLNERYQQGGISLSEMKEIMELFGRRGGRAIAAILKDFDKWREVLKATKEDVDGMAEKMKEAAESNLPMALKKATQSMMSGFVREFDGMGSPIAKWLNNSLNAKQQQESISAFAQEYMEILSSEFTKGKPVIGVKSGIKSLGIPGLSDLMGQGNISYGNEDTKKLISGGYSELADIIMKNKKEQEKIKEEEKQILKLNEKILKIKKEISWIQKTGIGSSFTKNKEAEILDLNKEILDIATKIRNIKSDKEISKEVSLNENLLRIKTKIKEEKLGEKEIEQELGNLVSSVFNKVDATSVVYDKTIEKLKEMIGYKKEELETTRELTQEEKDRVKVMEGYAANLEKGFAESMAKSIESGGGISGIFEDFLPKLRSQQVKAFSEGITEQLFEIGGIGGKLGAFSGQIRDAFRSPQQQAANYHAKKVKEAIIEAANYQAGVISGETAPMSFARASTGGISIPGLDFLNSPIGNATRANAPAFKYDAKAGGSRASQYANWKSNNAGNTYGQVLGVVGNAAMTGAAGAQGSGGMVAGIAGGVGSLMMGAAGLQAGAAAGSMFASGGLLGSAALGPIGLVLALGSLIYSMSQKPPEWSKTESKTTTQQITSRIDVTNNELQWVNRNLVALKQELTYIMQDSYYFKERDTADSFSTGSQRGGI